MDRFGWQNPSSSINDNDNNNNNSNVIISTTNNEVGRGDATVGNSRRVRISQFEFFELFP